MNLLPNNLAPLATIAAKESTKYALAGVQLELLPGNTYRATATDSKRLITVEGPCADATTYPAMPHLAAAPNGKTTALVPAKAWADVFKSAEKLTRKAYRPELRTVAAVVGETVTTFGSTDLERIDTPQTRNLDRRFPPVQDFIDSTFKDLPVAKIRVCAKRLAEVLKAMLDFTDETNCVSFPVEIELRGKWPEQQTDGETGLLIREPVQCDRPLKISAVNAAGQKTTGVLMSLYSKG